MPIIPALRRLKQENCHEFKINLSYIVSSMGYRVRPSLTNNQQTKTNLGLSIIISTPFSFYLSLVLLPNPNSVLTKPYLLPLVCLWSFLSILPLSRRAFLGTVPPDIVWSKVLCKLYKESSGPSWEDAPLVESMEVLQEQSLEAYRQLLGLILEGSNSSRNGVFLCRDHISNLSHRAKLKNLRINKLANKKKNFQTKALRILFYLFLRT